MFSVLLAGWHHTGTTPQRARDVAVAVQLGNPRPPPFKIKLNLLRPLRLIITENLNITIGAIFLLLVSLLFSTTVQVQGVQPLYPGLYPLLSRVYYTCTYPIAFVGEAGQIVGGTVVIVHRGLQIAVLFDFDPGLNLET